MAKQYAIVIRGNKTELSQLSKQYPDDSELINSPDRVRITTDPTGRGQGRRAFTEPQVPKDIIARKGRSYSLRNRQPEKYWDEPTLEQAKELILGLTPMMKRVLAVLKSAKSNVATLEKFPRSIQESDIQSVMDTFNNRAKSKGFLTETGDLPEVITQYEYTHKSGNTTRRYRLAKSVSTMLDLTEKKLD